MTIIKQRGCIVRNIFVIDRYDASPRVPTGGRWEGMLSRALSARRRTALRAPYVGVKPTIIFESRSRGGRAPTVVVAAKRPFSSFRDTIAGQRGNNNNRRASATSPPRRRATFLTNVRFKDTVNIETSIETVSRTRAGVCERVCVCVGVGVRARVSAGKTTAISFDSRRGLKHFRTLVLKSR